MQWKKELTEMTESALKNTDTDIKQEIIDTKCRIVK